MRTFATCVLFAAAFCSASGAGAQQPPSDHVSASTVTVVHELVVAPVAHSTHHRPNQPTVRRVASRVRRSRTSHAVSPRQSLLERVGRAIGITVRHR